MTDTGKRVQIRHVMRATALGMGVRGASLISDCRRKEWVRARQVAMYAAHHLVAGATSTLIGQWLGNRDHTTVLHGIRRVSDLMGTDAEFAAKVHAVLQLTRRIANNDPTVPKRVALPEPAPVPVVAPRSSKLRVRVRDCQAAAAQVFGVPIEAIQGRLADRDYSLPRLVATCVAYDLTNLEPRDIGAYFGGLDGSTVTMRARQARLRRSRDLAFRHQVETVARHAEAQARAWHASAAMPATDFLRTRTMEPST